MSLILRTIPVIVALCLVSASAQAKYSGGSGTAQNPYLIATAADLIALGQDPNGYGKHFVLTADIDLDPNLPDNRVFGRAVIAPDINNLAIGFQGPAFTGVFDGQGHAIADLVIDSSVPYTGLFGSIGVGGCVSSLRLVRGSVRGQGRTGAMGGTDGGTGGLAAENRGLITACGCEVIVNGVYRVGGLVGSNLGTISACYSAGSVSGGSYVGGLVGEDHSGTICACCTTGSVSGGNYTGGLVGEDDSGTICACYTTGSVSGQWYVGGLVGYNDGGTTSACYSTGSVTGTTWYSSVGGLVGVNDSGGTVSDCYSTGLVSGHSSYDGAGGLVAYNLGGTISACFWDTQTSGRTTSAGGTGAGTRPMQTVDTFVNAGWDFLGETAHGLCEYWQMPTGDGYPVLSVFNGCTPHIPQGTGTADDPYLLETAEDLGTVWYRPTASYQLAADIDLSGIKWGMAVMPAFSGSLDGQGHRIAGPNIVGGAHLGLIGHLAQGAAVHDLGLEDVNIVGVGGRVGSLVGSNDGAISACYSTGSVSGTGSGVGGLVGNNAGTISTCHSTGRISGGSYVGGLVGYNAGTVSACCSTGLISGNWGVGGLVGEDDPGGMISTCYSTGSVSGEWHVGGLVGHINAGTISLCYSTASVSGTQSYVGGLVGCSLGGTISACFWDTQISGRTTSAGGTGKTTSEMQTAQTFLDAGWPLVGETANGTEDMWSINDGKDYPRLRWEAAGKFDF